MKIKNRTSSIVSIGKVVILPDEVGEVTDPAYMKNNALNFMVETGRLEIVPEAVKPKKPAEAAKGKSDDK